ALVGILRDPELIALLPALDSALQFLPEGVSPRTEERSAESTLKGEKVPPSGSAVGSTSPPSLTAFHSPADVHAAYSHGKVKVHARIRLRLPSNREIVRESPSDRSEKRDAIGLITTTVGRVLFNEVLDSKLPFYDIATTGELLGRIIADCYRLLGRAATI